MNVIDLTTRLGGEFLANKARAIVDGKIVILARLIEHDWVYTEEGQTLADLQSNIDETKTPSKSRKKEAVVVESEPQQDEIATEIAPTPEQ
jgi:predicted GH43/DUF377 family glycosyl hydrolase